MVFGTNRDGTYMEIYKMMSDGSQVERLTTGDSNSFSGPFSPDGSLLVCTGFGLTNSINKTVNLDGSGQAQVAYVPDSDEGFPDWSPDGKQIVFTSRRDGNNEIYVMNADGSNPIRLTNNPTDDFAPNWSPDGSQIAFVSDRDRTIGYYSIYIMKTDDSSISIKLSELVIFLVFSHSLKVRAISCNFRVNHAFYAQAPPYALV